jgi:hypothetical protein
MSIYTPRGLAINLPVSYAFALMQRLYPTVDAFKVLKTVEGLQSIPGVFTFVTGLVCFYLKVAPYQIGLCIFCASVIGTVITLFGLTVPGLPVVGTLYSYVSGFGILFVVVVVYGFVAVGWQGVLALFVGRLLAAIINWVLASWNAKRLYARIDKRLFLPELNFLNAYRLHASSVLASPSMSFQEFKKRIDVSVSQDEMKEENWKPCFQDLALKWPDVVRRFTS